MASTRKQNEVIAKIIHPDTVDFSGERRMFTDASVRRLLSAMDKGRDAGFTAKRFMDSTGINRAQFHQWRKRLGIEASNVEVKPKANLSERTQAAIKGLSYRIKQLSANGEERRFFGADLRRDVVALYLTAKSEHSDYKQMQYAESIGVLTSQFHKWMRGMKAPSPGAHEPEQLSIPDPHSEAMNGNAGEVTLEAFPTQAIAVRKPTVRRRVEVTCVVKIEAENVAQAMAQLEQLPLEGLVTISISPYQGGTRT